MASDRSNENAMKKVHRAEGKKARGSAHSYFASLLESM
jgi:hypothetical protein